MRQAPVPIPEIPGYEIVKPLGSGGMATVYLAIQKSLERKVAIKVLHTNLHDDDPERTEKRFLREGRTLARITHKNVCGIYDIARVGEHAYIAMEYIDGGTLVERMRSGIAVGEAIAIVVQIASALQEAHDQGIVHRDLKPSNIMMRGGKVPVITDFGIAREFTSNQTKITAENMIVGTPSYMSPEQVSGGEVDGRSDLYSLGIMFYELLTGSTPYVGDTAIAVCMQHLTAPLPTLPADLAEIQPVLDRMLAKKREDRYPSMSAFTAALREVMVQSATLRQVLRFDTATPWSEQLRALGFSLDTVRDAELKRVLEQQRAAARSAQATARAPAAAPTAVPAVTVATRPAEASAARDVRPAQAVERPKYALIAAVAGGLLLLIVGGWLLLRSSGPSQAELAALTALARQFDTQIGQQEFFLPPGNNAANTLESMRQIDARAELTRSREAMLANELGKALRALVEEGKESELDLLLGQAAAALRAADFAKLNEEVGRFRAERAAALRRADTLRRLRAVLQGRPERSEDTLTALLTSLRSDFPAQDPERLAVEREVLTHLQQGARQALQQQQLDRAQLFLIELERSFPNAAETAALAAEIKTLQDRRGFEERLASVRGYLATRPMTPSVLDSALAAYRQAAAVRPEATELRPLATQLLGLLDAEFTRLVQGEEFDAADAFLRRARDSLGTVRELAAAERGWNERLATARSAAQQGTLVIDALPWARIVRITGPSGAVDLPREAATPLALRLPAGAYRIEAQAPDGTAVATQTATVERRRSALVRIESGRSAAVQDYLREAGL